MNDLRSQSARFFRDGDRGSHVVQLYTDAISYWDQGEWKPIDSTVVPTSGGFTNAANSFDVFFPETLSPGRPIVVKYPEGSLSFSLVGAAPAAGTPDGHTITYDDVYQATDLAIDVTNDGIKERAILASPRVSARMSYRVETQGFDLELQEDGSVTITHGGEPFGAIPPAFAVDSSKDPDSDKPAITYDVDAALRAQGPGAYVLDYEVDRDWINAPERVYPITVDPTLVLTRCEGYYPDDCPQDVGIPLIKDTYVRQGMTTPQDQKPFLVVDKTEGSQARLFMTFDFRQQVRKVGDLIYDGSFDILTDHSANLGLAKLEMRRITEDWDANTTWTNLRPKVDPKVWARHDGCGPLNCKDDWNQWDVADLMQYWIDNHVPTNHGWEISMNSTSPVAWKEFVSGEVADPYKRPYVNVWVNAMPGTKTFAMDDPDWPRLDLATHAMPNGTTVESTTPQLDVKPLTDENGDDIVVRYQVSKNPVPDFEDQIVYDSGWIAQTHSHQVPEGYLLDGTYHWRVQAGDVCVAKYADPDEPALGNDKFVCDDLGADTTRPNERPTSEIRSFTVTSAPPQVGKDPRWTMWTGGLGNGMELSVNQANGNAVLDYPIDSLGTPQGPLDVRLTYNSQQARHVHGEKAEPAGGLPPGWELAAGPSVRPDQMPARLEPLQYPTPAGPRTYGVAVTYESGKRDVFADSGGGLFTQAGPLAATVRSIQTGGWTMTTYSGGTYTFSAEGGLVRARPSSTTPDIEGFKYEVTGGRLRSLVDPLGRRLKFVYESVPGLTTETLTQIVSFEDQPEPDRLTWTLTYEAAKLASIKDPDNGTVTLGYHDTNNLLDEVLDGQGTASGKATMLEYQTADFGTDRPAVSKVSLPQVDVVPQPVAGTPRTYETAPSASRWSFDYDPSTTSKFSRQTIVESPRGAATGDADDFTVVTDFNDVGLAIMQRGPRVEGAYAGWPKTKMVWDFDTGNLLCVRGPAANVIADEVCDFGDALQTQYEYQKRPPYLLTKVTESAAEINGPRLTTTYGYDEGDGFQGLQTHYYERNDLAGLADATDITPAIAADWGEGGPPQIDGDSDFSVRYFGEWLPRHSEGTQSYEFRITAEDDVRLIVGKDVLVDCISGRGTSLCLGTTHHTVTAKGIEPGPKNIVVELRAITGPARVKLEWKRPNDTFEVVPSTALRPATDVLTSEKVGSVATPDAFSTTVYDYPAVDDKLRRLPARMELRGGPETSGSDHEASKPRDVTYLYDDHGRIWDETDATGQTVEHRYVGERACETSTLDRVGLRTTRSCNLSGDVEVETVTVDGLLDAGAGSEERVTTTAYTGLGRVDWVELPDGGKIDYAYDLAGRLESKSVLEASGVTRTTDYVRNARGWVVEKRLPDPDGEGGVARPVVKYRYDDDGNRIVTIEERGHSWVEEFDAANRRVLRRDPLGNERTWSHDAAGVLRKKTDPQDVVVQMTYDALNRLESRQLGSIQDKWATVYDLRGYVKKKTDPDGVWTSFEYDGAGEILRETTPAGSRTFSYDGSGFLKRQSNFRGHDTTFGYDDMGHLKSVKLPVSEPGEDTETTYVLNEAGEVERTLLPDGGGAWTYDYDPMGRVEEEVDPSGVVRTKTYNKAGEVRVATDGTDFRTEYFYDRLGRVDYRSAYRVGPPEILVETVDFSYDAAGNMELVQNAHETVSATYDAAGRLSTATAHGQTTTYDYVGSLLGSRTDAAGKTTYDYETDTGRIREITGPFGGFVSTLDYKPSGRLWHTWENVDLKTTYGYDSTGRLEKKSTTEDPETDDDEETEEYAFFSTEYNADSQVIERTTTIQDGTLSGSDNGTWVYSYDPIGRLRTATDPDDTFFEYDYDGAGNRTLVKETHQDNDIERVTSAVTDYDGAQPKNSTTTVTIEGVAAPPVETTYLHDDRGNLTRIDGPGAWRSFSYDHWGRLRTAQSGAPDEAAVAKHVYSYDGLDRTLAKASSSVTAGVETAIARELYWHAGLGHELVRTSRRGPDGADADSVLNSYAYRDGAPYAVQRVTPGAAPASSLLGGVQVEESVPDVHTTLLGTNSHGDVVFSMTRDHALQSVTSYDPWGAVRSQVGDDGMLGFQSDPTDPDTGLVDMEARNYLPELGRFLTRDLFEGIPTKPVSLNPYIYGVNDPVSNSDPDGFCSRPAICGPPPGQSPDQRRRSVELAQQGVQIMAPGPVYGPPTPLTIRLFRPYWGSTGEPTTIHFSGIAFEEGLIIPRPSGISVRVTAADAQVTPIRGTSDYSIKAQLFYQGVTDSDVPFQPGGRGLAVAARVCGDARSIVCGWLQPGQVPHSPNTWRARSYDEPTQEERAASRAGVFHWHGRVAFEDFGVPLYAEFVWVGESAPIPIAKNDRIWFPFHASEEFYYAGESPYE